MSCNRILFPSIKNKLSFYFHNHHVYESYLPYLRKRYMCSQVNRSDKYLLQKNSKKTNEISRNSLEINQKEIDCGDIQDEDIEMEDMFCETSSGKEWGGPMRGGKFYEPTRYGDWEREGRCTDF